MASNLRAMASNLLAMACNLRAMGKKMKDFLPQVNFQMKLALQLRQLEDSLALKLPTREMVSPWCAAFRFIRK